MLPAVSWLSRWFWRGGDNHLILRQLRTRVQPRLRCKPRAPVPAAVQLPLPGRRRVTQGLAPGRLWGPDSSEGSGKASRRAAEPPAALRHEGEHGPFPGVGAGLPPCAGWAGGGVLRLQPCPGSLCSQRAPFCPWEETLGNVLKRKGSKGPQSHPPGAAARGTELRQVAERR